MSLGVSNLGNSVPQRLLSQVQALLSSLLDSYKNRLWPGRFLVLVSFGQSVVSQQQKRGKNAWFSSSTRQTETLDGTFSVGLFAIAVVNMGANSYSEQLQQPRGHKSWQIQLTADHGFRAKLPRASVHRGTASQLVVVDACAGGCSRDSKPGNAKTMRGTRLRLQPSKICPRWPLPLQDLATSQAGTTSLGRSIKTWSCMGHFRFNSKV